MQSQTNSTPAPRYTRYKEKRFRKTLHFLEEHITKSSRILDLGPPNNLSKLMIKEGYAVKNTPATTDLDIDYEIVKENFDVVTAFEIIEHMVSPFPLLSSVKAKKLVASVPLKLWFANAYWNNDDPFDRHYHEFEQKQFDMLLDKAGWEIIKSEKWIIRSFNKIGIRPVLRNITPKYYIVYCEKKRE
jgi:hypothetical protein